MKKAYIILVVAVLVIGGMVGTIVLVGGGSGSKYDQSTIEATAKSFIIAMINGDTEGMRLLTKDVLMWQYSESDLLRYHTQYMEGTTINQYYYYRDLQGAIAGNAGKNAVVVYDKMNYPSPKVSDFFCMDFVEAEGKFYINELVIPGGWHDAWHATTKNRDWPQFCKAGIADGGKKFD